MTPSLKQSLAICLAGKVNSGKTTQAKLCFDARFILPDGSTFHPFDRVLYVAVGGDKQSAAGAADSMVTSSGRCVFYKPLTVDQCLSEFPGILAKGINGKPFNMVVMDSWSSFKDQAAADVRARAITEAGGKSLAGQAAKKIANNPRDIHRFAAGDVSAMIEIFNSAGIDHPALLISMIHTEDLYENDVHVGQKPVASATCWRRMHSAQNIIWHMERQLGEAPTMRGMTIEQMNAATQPDTFVAYTMAKKYPMPTGKLPHVKRQGGGSMAAFDQLPPCWESPNLGTIMLDYLCNSNGIVVGEQDDPNSTAHWVDSQSIQLH